MSNVSQEESYEAAAAAADRVFRETRTRAVVSWSVFAVGITAMVAVGALQPEARRGPGLVAVGFGIIGFCGGLVFAMRAYAAWGIRRICEARVSLPDLGIVAAEHRRATLLATAFGAMAIASWAFMFVLDENRWLAPIVASLFLVGCAGTVHFLLVCDVTRRLQDLCRENPEHQPGNEGR